MTYIGIQTQQRRNNLRSAMLLGTFPLLVLALTYLVVLALTYFAPLPDYTVTGPDGKDLNIYATDVWTDSTALFVEVIPWVLGGVALWFAIAYLFNTQIINSAVRSRPLERSENKRIYNLVENLTMAVGMPMPQINIIDTPALNAFASGINARTYTVTLTTGIIEALSDDELEGVIAHELTHIRNRDVRVLIVSIVFVGIFSLIMSVAFHAMLRVRGGKNSGTTRLVLLVVALVAGIGVLASSLMKFGISRQREFMADAGAAEMTRKPLALAGALRKISGRSHIQGVDREDVAQLFIDHPAERRKKNVHAAEDRLRAARGNSNDDLTDAFGDFSDPSDEDSGDGIAFSNPFSGLFATHPPIEKRIEVLEQF